MKVSLKKIANFSCLLLVTTGVYVFFCERR